MHATQQAVQFWIWNRFQQTVMSLELEGQKLQYCQGHINNLFWKIVAKAGKKSNYL